MVDELARDGGEVKSGVCGLGIVAIDEELTPQSSVVLASSSDRGGSSEFINAGVPREPKKALTVVGPIIYPVHDLCQDFGSGALVARLLSLMIVCRVCNNVQHPIQIFFSCPRSLLCIQLIMNALLDN